MISSDPHHSNSDCDEQAVRQIAILLQSMPQRTHRVLLGQLNSKEKQSITAAMSDLGAIDAMEQHRVLQRLHSELQTETSRVDKVESEIRDEIEIGRARVSKKRSGASYANGVSSKTMADQPSETTLQSSGASTGTVGHDSINGLGDDTRTGFDAGNHSSSAGAAHASGVGHPGLDASISRPLNSMQSMFTQFHQTQAAGILPANATAGAQQATGQDPDRWIVPFSDSSPSGFATNAGRDRSSAMTAKEIAERIDRYLIQTPDEVICRALGQISTKQVFLVLCGLPNSKAESVLDQLPRRQAKKVRSDMRKMGQLQLSDIDAAKQHVAEIVMDSQSSHDSMAA